MLYILWLCFKDNYKETYDDYTECYRKHPVFDIFKSAVILPIFQYIRE